jgi:hypothetical protein
VKEKMCRTPAKYLVTLVHRYLSLHVWDSCGMWNIMNDLNLTRMVERVKEWSDNSRWRTRGEKSRKAN